MKFERLGNIITIAKGKKPAFAESPNENSIRVLQIDDLRNDNNIKYTDDKSGVFAKEDDIILAWDGANAGTIGFGKTGFIGSTLAVLRKNNSKEFDTVFIGKFLQTQFDFLRSKSTGATIPHINRNSLESLKIPCLSLSDQIQIANILSKAETLIEQRKQSIALLDEFLKSSFWEMFGEPGLNDKGFVISKIKEQCQVKGGKRIPKGSNLIKENTGYPYIKAGNIKNGKITLKEIEFLTDDLRNKLKRYTVEKGDVCITVVGVNIGDIGIVPDELHLANLTENANKLLIKNKDVLSNIYLAHYLMSNFVQQDFANSIKATGVPKLALYRIEETNLLLPPIKLQTQFATIVTKTETLKEQYKNSLQELENLYGSLSQQAFKGELVFSKEKSAAEN